MKKITKYRLYSSFYYFLSVYFGEKNRKIKRVEQEFLTCSLRTTKVTTKIVQNVSYLMTENFQMCRVVFGIYGDKRLSDKKIE